MSRNLLLIGGLAALVILACLAYPALAASKPSYIIAFVPLEWYGSLDEFQRVAQEHGDLFVRESGIDAYADVTFVFIDEVLTGVSLRDEDGRLLNQVVRFGLSHEPADRYIGLTNSDLAPNGDSSIMGYTSFFDTGVLAEAPDTSVTAHELGHTYGLCDEYLYAVWVEQDTWLDGCPNPFPVECSPGEWCEGAPAPNGNVSIMGPAMIPGAHSFNQPCYDHLQVLFTEMFGYIQPALETPTPTLPTATATPGPSPTPAPTLAPLSSFVFTAPALKRWDTDLGIMQLAVVPALQPDWSPDGQWVAYVSASDGDLDLYLVPATGGQGQQLVNAPGRQLYPRWLPDSQWLVYVSEEQGVARLQLLNIIKGDTRVLESLPSPAAWPAVSPDGKYLAFSAAPSGDWDLYMVELADGGQIIPGSLTSPGSLPGYADISPDWSPDGSALVFASDRYGSLDLFIYQLENHSLTELLADTPASNEWAPRWGTGSQIFFQATDGEALSIGVIDPDNGAIQMLLDDLPMAAWPDSGP